MTELDPNVLLEGGPVWSELGSRVRYVEGGESVLKVRSGNCYEHFHRTEKTTEHEGRSLRVFEWIRSTYLAE